MDAASSAPWQVLRPCPKVDFKNATNTLEQRPFIAMVNNGHSSSGYVWPCRAVILTKIRFPLFPKKHPGKSLTTPAKSVGRKARLTKQKAREHWVESTFTGLETMVEPRGFEPLTPTMPLWRNGLFLLENHEIESSFPTVSHFVAKPRGNRAKRCSVRFWMHAKVKEARGGIARFQPVSTVAFACLFADSCWPCVDLVDRTS